MRRRNPQPRLLEYYDLREFDFDTGRPIPLRAGEGAICERCGREHAKVYVVQTVEGTTKSVGSGCCKRAFEGWEPSKEEIKTAKAAFRSKREAAREARLAELAAPITAALDRLTIPDWQEIGERSSRFGRTQVSLGDRGLDMVVWLDASDFEPGHEASLRERRDTYASHWLGKYAERWLQPPAVRGFDSHAILRHAIRDAVAHRWHEDLRLGATSHMQFEPVP